MSIASTLDSTPTIDGESPTSITTHDSLVRRARLSYDPDRDSGAVPSQRDLPRRRASSNFSLCASASFASSAPPTRPGSWSNTVARGQSSMAAPSPGRTPRRSRAPSPPRRTTASEQSPASDPRRNSDRLRRRPPQRQLIAGTHGKSTWHRQPPGARCAGSTSSRPTSTASPTNATSANPRHVAVPDRALHRADPRDHPSGHDQHRVTLTNRPGRHLTPHGTRAPSARFAPPPPCAPELPTTTSAIDMRNGRTAVPAPVDGGQRVDGLRERSAGPTTT